MKDGPFSVSGVLYDMSDASGFSDEDGRVPVGRAASAHLVRIVPNVEILREQETGGHPTRVRMLGYEVVYNVKIIDYNESVMKLVLGGLSDGSAFRWGDENHPWGEDAQPIPIAIIDDDEERPSLYIPMAVHTGPITFSVGRPTLLNSELEIEVIGLFDRELGCPAVWGSVADMPEINNGQ